jgi:arylsulfatase A
MTQKFTGKILPLRIFGCALLLSAGSVVNAAGTAGQTAKPNILVILADDLGYGDVQCHKKERGKIPTPNLDRLATQGMRFTDAHSSSGVCSPSRYALLTGRYHWRTRLQTGIVGAFGKPLIAADRLTIASLAMQHDYRTVCIGKWHLGWEPSPAESR